LPVPYFHVVFTLPQQIGRLALQNAKPVYNILCAASQTPLETAADPRRGASFLDPDWFAPHQSSVETSAQTRQSGSPGWGQMTRIDLNLHGSLQLCLPYQEEIQGVLCLFLAGCPLRAAIG
jgi:hypothetical protein